MALFDFLFGGGESAPPVQSSGITQLTYLNT